MFELRKDEQNRAWFRSDRVFTVDGFWYFATREGRNIGPYDTQPDAQVEAALLRELYLTSPDPDATVEEFVREGNALASGWTPNPA